MGKKGAHKNPRRRQWLYAQQNGECYLRMTDRCRSRRGIMRLEGKKRKDFASFDHVVSKFRKEKGAPALLLLACCDCNNAKGSQKPLDSHVALATRLHNQWLRENGHEVQIMCEAA